MEDQTNGYIQRFRRIIEDWEDCGVWCIIAARGIVSGTLRLSHLEGLNGIICKANKDLVSLFDNMLNQPPLLAEGRTALAYMLADFRRLGIPPFDPYSSWPVEVEKVLYSRFPRLVDKDGFERTAASICAQIRAFVMNFAALYKDIGLVADEDNPVLSPVEAAAGWPGRNSVGGLEPAGGMEGEPASRPAPRAADRIQPTPASLNDPGSADRIFIPTELSRPQLERLYLELVKGGFVEAGREDDFLLCFDPGAENQGGFVWVLRGEKNKGQVVIQALCDFLYLLGIGPDDFGQYIEALCYNIPVLTKSARKKARRDLSRYYGRLKEILEIIKSNT